MPYGDHSLDKGHRRIETRRTFAIGELDTIDGLDLQAIWPGLQSVAMVESAREINNVSTTERRYCISSLPANASGIGDSVHLHWGIGNSLHGVMDVAFHEDYSRNRKDHSVANMATMRRFALNLIKQDKTTEDSIKVKRKRAGWKDDYLLTLLGVRP